MNELAWKKSSRCEAGACPEVAFVAGCEAGDCPEVALCGCGVQIRESSRPDVVVTFTREGWDAFVAGVKAGDFDKAGEFDVA